MWEETPEVPHHREHLECIRCPACTVSALRGQPRCPKAAGRKAVAISSTYVACSGQLLPYPLLLPMLPQQPQADRLRGRSLIVVSGPLDMALLVTVQPVCIQMIIIIIFCSFIFCSGIMFSERPAGGARLRSLGPCSDETVLVV